MIGDELTTTIKALAVDVGFLCAGVASPVSPAHVDLFKYWLAEGLHGDMAYMTRHAALRSNPCRLVPGAKSILSLAAAYETAGDRSAPEKMPRGVVARYAVGRDYHKTLKRRCHVLMDRIRGMLPEFEGRAFVDSAPVMERSLAAGAGLGWIGKNGCLITPTHGSYVLLAEIVSNLPLCPDTPLDSQCHNCGECVRACPMGAIREDGLVDARKCISYLTIEHCGPIAPELREEMGDCLFGCDACQAACPHNRHVIVGDPPSLPLADVLAWNESDWDIATRGSAMRRATHAIFLRNAAIAAGHSGDESLIAPLEMAANRCTELAAVARWAIGRLK